MFNKTKNSLTIVIPVKNEEGNIVNTLQAIKDKVKLPHEVIVVDGRSMDQTYSLVKNYVKKNRNVRIIRTTPANSPFKESLFVGIKAARTEFVATFMGDLSDDPATLNKMYEKARNGSDVVIASRYIPGGNIINKPLIQKVVSWTVNKTLHFLTGIPVHDVSNPYGLYRRKLIVRIKPVSNANEIPIEIVFRAYFKGVKISEVPTVWRGRKIGKSKFKILKVVPGYSKLYIWVVLNSWKKLISST